MSSRRTKSQWFALGIVVTLTLLSLGVGPANAAVLYWDNGAATGVWATTTNWDTTSDGTGGNPTAAPGASDVAYFNVSTLNTAQTVTTAAISIGGVVANSTGTVGITNSGKVTVGTTGIHLTNGSGGLSFSGAVQLTGDAVAVPTTLLLDSTAGPLTIGGALTIGSGTTDGPQKWVNNSSSTVTIASVAGGNTRALTIDGPGNFTVTGAFVNGTSTMTKTGTGTLSLNNVTNNSNWVVNGGTVSLGSTYAGTGTFTLTSGLLKLGAATPFTNATAPVLTFAASSTGKLQLNGSAATVRNAATNATLGTPIIENGGSTNATLNVNLDATKTYAGTLQDGSGGGTLAVTLNNASGFVWNLTALNGPNTYTGGTNINSGTLSFANGALGSTGNIVFTNTATLQWNGTNTQDISSRLRMNSVVPAMNATLDTGANNVVFGSTIGNTASGGASSANLIKTGSGSLTLFGTSTYTGATSVALGTLIVPTTGALPGYNASGRVAASAGGTLMLQDWSDTDLGLLVTNNIGNFAPGSFLGLSVTGGTATYTTLLTGSEGLAKGGAGTVVLTAANNYTGATAVRAGTLQLSAGASLPSGTNVTVGNDAGTATLNLNGQNQTIGTLGFGGSTTTSGAAVTTGVGTLTLGGDVTYTATNNPLGATISGKLDLGSATRTFTVGDSTSAAQDLTVSADIATSSAGLTKAGAGLLLLSGNNTYSGTTTLSAGTLSIGSDSNIGGSASAITFNGGMLQVTGTAVTNLDSHTVNWDTFSGGLDIAATSNAFTVNSAVTAAGGVTKAGTGTLNFAQPVTMGANTLTVKAGTLLVDHDITLAGGTTGRLWVGDTAGDNAAVVQTAGTVSFGGTDGANTQSLGRNDGTFGSYTVVGGTYAATRGDIGGQAATGANGKGVGILNVLNGGTASFSTYFIGGRNTGAVGVVNLAGGTIDASTLKTNTGAWGGGRFEVNLGVDLGSGNSGGLADFGAKTYNVVGNTASSTGITNLLAGTLRANAVSTLAASTNALFNFNGGTLQYSGTVANATFLPGTNFTGQSGVRIYSGGATIDDNGQAITVSANLLAPTGNGVTGVAVDTVGSGYFAAPVVQLINASGDTTGFGATAAAIMDPSTGTVTGIVVTNPGTGYTLAPTVQLTDPVTGLTWATTGTAATATASIGANSSSGGLTKNGTGTLTLSGANTYAGPTNVTAGTLQVTKQVGLYNNQAAAPWNDTNIVVQNFAALGLNVGGTGEFTATDLDTLLPLGTWSGGFMSGSTVALDTTNASGGNFTYNGAIVDTNGGNNLLGVRKLGTGTLTLGGVNTYSGNTAINAGLLAITATTALPGWNTPGQYTVAAGAGITVGGATPEADLQTMLVTGNFAVGAYAGFDVPTAGSLTLSTVFSDTYGGHVGALGLAKTGAGTLTVNNAGTFTGGLNANAGTLVLGGNNTFTGGVTIGSATLQLANAGALNATAPNAVTFGASSTGVLQLNGNSITVPSLSTNAVPGTPVVENANVTAATLTVNNTAAGTFAGVLRDGGVGSLSLTKLGTGALTLTGANTYNGATNVAAGTLTLSGAGTIGSPAGVTILNGGTFKIDNAASPLAGGRIPDTAPLTNWGKGTFTWAHSATAATNYTETFGVLALNPGVFIFSGTQAAADGTSVVTFDSVSRTAGATAKFTGTGIGADNRNAVKFLTTAPTEVNNVIPWAFVDPGTGGAAMNLAATDGVNTAVRGYSTGVGAGTETYKTAATGWLATDNVRLLATASMEELGAAITINSLTLDSGVSVSADSFLTQNHALTITSGAILQTGGTSTINSSGTFDVIPNFGANEGFFHVASGGTLIIDRRTGNTSIRGTGGFVKDGLGTLLLKNVSQKVSANPMLGNFYVNEGVLKLQTANSPGGTTIVLSGGSLELTNDANTTYKPQDDATSVPIVVPGDGTITVSRVTSGTGAVTPTVGTLTVGNPLFPGTLTIARDATNFSGTNQGYGLTAGAATMNGNVTFSVAKGVGTGDGIFTMASLSGANYNANFVGGGRNDTYMVINGNVGIGSGNLSVSAGSLRVGTAGLAGQTGNINVGATGVLVISDGGTFNRPLGTGAGQVQVTGVTAGFGAYGLPAIVDIGGTGAAGVLQFGSTNFNATTALLLNDALANNTLELKNSLDLNTLTATEREIIVDGNVATVSGDIKGTGSLFKAGGSWLSLTGNLTYDGTTRVSGGYLRLANVADQPTGKLPAGNLYLNAANNTAVLEGAGSFERALGTGNNQVHIVGGTGTNNSRNGFSAYGGDLTVNIDGLATPSTLQWDTADFDPNGTASDGALMLQASSATNVVTLKNSLDLAIGTVNEATRRIEVNSTLSSAFKAVIEGQITNSTGTAGTFVKRGAGLLELTGANNFGDGTITQITAGVLRATDGVGLPANSNLTFNAGFFETGVDFVRPLGTAAGEVQFIGTGGVSAYGSNINVNLFNDARELTWATGSFVPAGSNLVLNAATADKKLTLVNRIDLNGAARTINVNAVLPTVSPFDSNAAEITGIIRNSVVGTPGGIAKGGVGLLILSGANTYDGLTQIDTGVLRAADGVGLPSTSNLLLSGGVYETNSTFTRAVGTGANQISKDASASGFSAHGGNLVIDLGGDGNHTGPALTMGDPNWTQFANTILNEVTADSNLEWQNPLNLAILDAGAQTRTFTVNAMTATLSGGINTGGPTVALQSVAKAGPGTLVLSGANGSWNGDLLVNDGQLNIDGVQVTIGNAGRVYSTVPGGTARLWVKTGSTLSLTLNTANLRVGYTGGDATATNIVDISGTVQLATGGAGGNVNLGTAGALAQVNLLSGGLIVANGVQITAGATATEFNFNGGTLKAQVANATFMEGLTSAHVKDGGGTVDTNTFDVTIAQPLLISETGIGGLTKNGAGTLTLSGANTYGGGTTVNDGTVTFANALALPAGSNVTTSATGVVVFSSGYTGVITSGGPGAAPAMGSPAPVPEPGTIALLAAAALMGAGVWLRRKGRK